MDKAIELKFKKEVINEARESKRELERNINDLVSEFNNKYGIRVNTVEIRREENFWPFDVKILTDSL